jgi:hypothetical protein
MGMGAADAARELTKCASAIRALAGVPSRASKPAAEAIRGLIQLQFAEARDPYGRPWKKLAASTIRRKGHSTINVETGATRDDVTVRPTSGAGVEVVFTTPYAIYIQRVRPIFPYAFLPRAWDQALTIAVERERVRALAESGARDG